MASELEAESRWRVWHYPRAMKKTFAVGAILLAIGLQAATAAAAPGGIPLEPAPAPAPAANTDITAPFDPICPLCFVREWIETIS